MAPTAERSAAERQRAAQIPPTAPPASLDEAEQRDPAEDQALAEAEARAEALEQEAIARQRELDTQAARIRELEGQVQAGQASMSAMDAEGAAQETASPAQLAQLQAAEKPADQGGMFRVADAFKPWRIRAAVGNFNGITEGFQFAGGSATVNALPPGASAGRVAVRVLRLNNIRNYDFYTRDPDARLRRLVTHRHVGYEVLTLEQYEAKYPAGDEDGEEVPEDL